MRLAACLNTTPGRVESREYNIWFGISLGNRYFSKQHLEKYIPWLVAHVRESLLIVVADEIHAINLEVLDGYTPARAVAVAQRKGKEKIDEVIAILKSLSPSDQQKVKVIPWAEIEKIPEKQKFRALLKEEFGRNEEFKRFVIGIVKEYPKTESKKLTASDYERLSEYILRELPVYINGAVYKDCRYLLQPYPGLGKIDELIMGLQSGTLFSALAKKLNITNKIAILEAYVE